MRGADAGEAAGHNLAALGHKPLQQTDIPVGDGVDLLGAELADLLAAEELAASAGSAGSPGRPPGRPPGPPDRRTTGRAFALRCWCARFGRFYLVSSDMLFPLYSVGFLALMRGAERQ